jgi:hypothetical protein
MTIYDHLGPSDHSCVLRRALQEALAEAAEAKLNGGANGHQKSAASLTAGNGGKTAHGSSLAALRLANGTGAIGNTDASSASSASAANATAPLLRRIEELEDLAVEAAQQHSAQRCAELEAAVEATALHVVELERRNKRIAGTGCCV